VNKEEKEEILPYTATSQLYAKEKRNLLDELQLPLGIHVCLSPTKHKRVRTFLAAGKVVKKIIFFYYWQAKFPLSRMELMQYLSAAS